MTVSDILYNPEIYCKAGWELEIEVTDDDDVAINLTGFAVYCEIRDRPNGLLIASPSITVTPASGLIDITLTPVQTKAIGITSAVIDVLMIEIAAPTNISPVLRGEVKIYPAITIIETTMAGTLTSGLKIITGLDTTRLVAGMAITGTGVGAGSTIATIDSPTQVTGTVNSTASGSKTITFSL